MQRLAITLALVVVAGCGTTASTIPSSPAAGTATAALRQAAAPRPFTPGVDPEPETLRAPVRSRTPQQAAAEALFGSELADPQRAAVHPPGIATSGHPTPLNTVAGGNGESVGLITSPTFSAGGSVVTIGVQPYYTVRVGGNFFHTHQFVNNECFEYGINYSVQAPTLFAYDWCTGGNTAQGWMNVGFVGDPGGIINTWKANGAADLLHWDAANHIDQITLEEIRRADGWHLLGYKYVAQTWVDLMNGRGVTGTKSACCGWSIFENHVSPAASCRFDPSFPTGAELLYDIKMMALVGGMWKPLDEIADGGFTFSTQVDCANISGAPLPGYVSPYFSGGYVSPYNGTHAGDWWMIQS